MVWLTDRIRIPSGRQSMELMQFHWDSWHAWLDAIYVIIVHYQNATILVVFGNWCSSVWIRIKSCCNIHVKAFKCSFPSSCIFELEMLWWIQKIKVTACICHFWFGFVLLMPLLKSMATDLSTPYEFTQVSIIVQVCSLMVWVVAESMNLCIQWDKRESYSSRHFKSIFTWSTITM